MPRFQINRRPLLRLAASLALAAGLSPALTPAFAQTQVQVPGGEVYPSKVVTIIVPYAAGSPPDQYSRVFAEKLRPRIGQNVIIENRPGALTTVGMGFAARAKPDGYTIAQFPLGLLQRRRGGTGGEVVEHAFDAPVEAAAAVERGDGVLEQVSRHQFT